MKHKKTYTPTEIEETVRDEVRNFLSEVDWQKFNPQGVYTLVALLKEIFLNIHDNMKANTEANSQANETFYTFVLTVLLDFIEEEKTIEENTKEETKH
jgi:hypothetical protein|tara:strand:- start:534 stop:827 length:294 start_codon:yes stop_codon:yes gene_type:complete